MKKKLLRLSAKEDAVVTKAAQSDADARPLIDKEWAEMKLTYSRGSEKTQRGLELNNKSRLL